jgi:hypothetical protein
MTIREVADELSRRLSRLFLRDESTGRRAAFGAHEKYQREPNFRDYLQFYEYFHGDTGRGVGATHQTGWTGLIAVLLNGVYNDQNEGQVARETSGHERQGNVQAVSV